jgi:hypothetical protein
MALLIVDNDDPPKARAFAAQWLPIPLRSYHEAGHRLPYEALARIAEDSSASLTDLDERIWGGTATGELVKILFALARSDPRRASWSNAVKVFCIAKDRSAKGSRTDLLEAKQRFSSVAHLWGAWSIREGRFEPRPDLGYDGYDDFQSFLAEAERIRHWGQTWQPPRANSSPLFPADIWRPPETWRPPKREPNWPDTGRVADLRLPDHLLSQLRPAGRPRQT